MQHKDVKNGNVHIIHNFEFENVDERNGYVGSVEDLNKICLVNVPYGFYALKSIEPIEWKPLSTVTINLEDFSVLSAEETIELISAKQSSYDITSSEFSLGYKRGGKEVFGIEIDCGALPNATIKTITIPNYNELNNYWIDTSKSYAKSGKEWTVTLPFTSNTNTNTNVISIMLNNEKIRITTLYNFSFYTETKIVLNYTKG